MADPGAFAKLDLGPTLGANEIGILISSVFLGITTVQLYMYFKNDFKDPLWIRLLVSNVRVYNHNFCLIFFKGDFCVVIGFSWLANFALHNKRFTYRSLETVHTIFVWIYLYDITVTNYGNPSVLAASPWTLSMSSVFDGIIGGTVQVHNQLNFSSAVA
jgi:hypothetical protein